MRRVAAALYVIAHLSGTAASAESNDPPPISIDDDGTIHMHGDTLVVRKDGTVSIGNFEFSLEEDGTLSIGHQDAEQRLKFDPNGKIQIGKGLSLESEGNLTIGYGGERFYALPNGEVGLQNTDRNKMFSLSGGSLKFAVPMVTGTISLYDNMTGGGMGGPQTLRKRQCTRTGSGVCTKENGPACKVGEPEMLAREDDYEDSLRFFQYVCYGQ